jgi:hypothetical protein
VVTPAEGLALADLDAEGLTELDSVDEGVDEMLGDSLADSDADGVLRASAVNVCGLSATPSMSSTNVT